MGPEDHGSIKYKPESLCSCFARLVIAPVPPVLNCLLEVGKRQKLGAYLSKLSLLLLNTGQQGPAPKELTHKIRDACILASIVVGEVKGL